MSLQGKDYIQLSASSKNIKLWQKITENSQIECGDGDGDEGKGEECEALCAQVQWKSCEGRFTGIF